MVRGAKFGEIMRIRTVFAALMAIAFASDVGAQSRERLGFGILFTNDVIDGAEDRWRTGSVTTSRIWGPTWTGLAPERFGELIELRIHGEVISPQNITAPAPDDRLYAGALSFGLHTHMQRGAMEFAVGADIVFVGPQTQLDEIQSAFHDVIDIAPPSDAVLDAQIGNTVEPTLVLEAGRTIRLGDNTVLRPFAEARAGVETLVRVGADLTFGALGQGELLVRDPVAGQRYRAVAGDWTGISLTLGADLAYVESSTFLPEDRGPELEDMRHRVRAGVMWQGENGASSFAGVTYLSEEFEGQGEGQFVGSLRVSFEF